MDFKSCKTLVSQERRAKYPFSRVSHATSWRTSSIASSMGIWSQFHQGGVRGKITTKSSDTMTVSSSSARSANTSETFKRNVGTYMFSFLYEWDDTLKSSWKLVSPRGSPAAILRVARRIRKLISLWKKSRRTRIEVKNGLRGQDTWAVVVRFGTPRTE